MPRADGDREALRIMLVARQEITEASTAQAGYVPWYWPVTAEYRDLAFSTRQ